MRLVFMGTPEFTLPVLDALWLSSHQVVACVTVPDKPRGRGQQYIPSPVKIWALNHNLPVLQPESLRDPDFINRLEELRAECFVVVAFRILPPEVYRIPERGAFNLHASLLPKYRGAAPIQWALIHGEEESGVTTFFLREKVDTGAMLIQKRIPLSPDMTAGELHDALAILGAEVVLETLQGIEQGHIEGMEQDESLACPAPKIFRDTCRLDWKLPAANIHNLVRGLSPVPAAWTHLNGSVLKILRTGKTEKPISAGPAELVQSGERLFAGCGDGPLEILELQMEGRKAMSTPAFLRGYRLPKGSVME